MRLLQASSRAAVSRLSRTRITPKASPPRAPAPSAPITARRFQRFSLPSSTSKSLVESSATSGFFLAIGREYAASRHGGATSQRPRGAEEISRRRRVSWILARVRVPSHPQQAHLQPGYRLDDRYELLYPFAEGGMATVWVARVQGSTASRSSSR